MLAATLAAVPGSPTSRRDRPRRRPDKIHADEGYDHHRRRRQCRARCGMPRTARLGMGSSEELRRYRWIVERIPAWLARFRRLVTRYGRRAALQLDFMTLAQRLTCGA